MVVNREGKMIQIEEGQVYSTGNVKFIITEVNHVTEFFAKVLFRLLDAGSFSNWDICCGSKEIELGLSLGEISLVESLTTEK
jgi:hypothetical protein